MTATQQDSDGLWRQSIPLPFFTARWTWRPPFLVDAFQCWACEPRQTFATEQAYRDHYRSDHPDAPKGAADA